MKWHFKCPLCGADRSVEWEKCGANMNCASCKKDRVVPGPAAQHDGYVDQHDWPKEMEKVVYSVKGTSCVISGCKATDITLDHVIAWDNNGKTSVSNLQPMCKSHNSSKGTDNFSAWLKANNYKVR